MRKIVTVFSAKSRSNYRIQLAHGFGLDQSKATPKQGFQAPRLA
jgi:hypothetical protein